MAKCRPSKWVPYAVPGVLLPLLAAFATTSGGLVEDVQTRAAQALSANELTAWAKVESNGRDLKLVGTAPSQEAVDAAVQAVAGTYGVRTATNTVQVVEPVKMTAPTVDSVNVAVANPEIKGTWHEGVATGLTVGLAGTMYKLGESPELTSMAGNWLLKPTTPLPEGSFDITVETTDGKQTLAAPAPGKLVVDLPDPPAPEVKLALPTVESYLGNLATPVIKGTWPEADAKAAGKNLQVKLADNLFVLGTNPELTTDGTGNWQLLPSMPLLEGELSIMPGIVGTDGKWITAEAPGKVTVDVTPPVVPALKMAAPEMKWPYPMGGTWAEEPGSKLAATFAGRSYALGTDAALTSDGKGNFSFDPKVELAPGSYDLDVNVTDAAGNTVGQKLAAAVVIPEPVKVEPLKPAALEPVAPDAKWPYAITGVWDERPGNTLSATVAGRSYQLGRGAALTSDGSGKFSFAPSARFAPGNYDVDFVTTDAAGAKQVVTAKAAIVVPEPAAPPPPPPPPAPEPLKAAVVDAPAADAKWPYAITGMWDERPGNSLSASVAGRSYQLGRGAALTSDGAGKFSFAPSARFAPGSYDVDFTTTDAAGAVQTATLKAAIVVPEPAAAAPPPPPPPPAVVKVVVPPPTVTAQVDLTGAPLIKGTWPHTIADKFSVAVGGRTYSLGKDQNLSAKDGNWTLFPATPLKDGKYNVIAVASAGPGNLAFDESKDELEVDADQAAAPAVETYSGDVSPTELKGTWDQANAKGLKVAIPSANLTAELGAAASPLYSDGKGNWRLVLAQPLAAGSYDVNVESVDRHGRVQAEATMGEVIVVAKGQEPPPPPPPYDCVAVMNRIGSVFPIRFEYDMTDITKPFDLSVSQYAALLKDPRCTSINVEIEGHADFRGSEIYNMGLSERRAVVIRDMLVKAGVEPARLSVRALGESVPLDAAETDEARMKNRRVQITAKP